MNKGNFVLHRVNVNMSVSPFLMWEGRSTINLKRWITIMPYLGIKRVFTCTSKFHNYAYHIGSSNVISLSMLACVNVLPWLGKSTFHWYKALQHQNPCSKPMVLVSVKDIVSLKMDSESK